MWPILAKAQHRCYELLTSTKATPPNGDNHLGVHDIVSCQLGKRTVALFSACWHKVCVVADRLWSCGPTALLQAVVVLQAGGITVLMQCRFVLCSGVLSSGCAFSQTTKAESACHGLAIFALWSGACCSCHILYNMSTCSGWVVQCCVPAACQHVGVLSSVPW